MYVIMNGKKQKQSQSTLCEYSHHEDFPHTVDGKEVAKEVKVFSLECLWVLNSLLQIKEKKFANHLPYIQEKGVVCINKCVYKGRMCCYGVRVLLDLIKTFN